jgi:hypothetical protein
MARAQNDGRHTASIQLKDQLVLTLLDAAILRCGRWRGIFRITIWCWILTINGYASQVDEFLSSTLHGGSDHVFEPPYHSRPVSQNTIHDTLAIRDGPSDLLVLEKIDLSDFDGKPTNPRRAPKRVNQGTKAGTILVIHSLA